MAATVGEEDTLGERVCGAVNDADADNELEGWAETDGEVEGGTVAETDGEVEGGTLGDPVVAAEPLGVWLSRRLVLFVTRRKLKWMLPYRAAAACVLFATSSKDRGPASPHSLGSKDAAAHRTNIPASTLRQWGCLMALQDGGGAAAPPAYATSINPGGRRE